MKLPDKTISVDFSIEQIEALCHSIRNPLFIAQGHLNKLTKNNNLLEKYPKELEIINVALNRIKDYLVELEDKSHRSSGISQ